VTSESVHLCAGVHLLDEVFNLADHHRSRLVLFECGGHPCTTGQDLVIQPTEETENTLARVTEATTRIKSSQRGHVRRRKPVDIGTPRRIRLLIPRLPLLPLQHVRQLSLLAVLWKTTRYKVPCADDGRFAGASGASGSVVMHVAVSLILCTGVVGLRSTRRGLIWHIGKVCRVFGLFGLFLLLPL
jgi:hypothetical protein